MRGRVACGHTVAVFCKERNGFLHGARAQQLELRETQSSPPAGTAVSRRDGSSGWRSGPLPRYQSDPPCSRNLVGEVGSTPSVRLIAFAFFLAHKAESTRSGVNGDSCRRTPTAS